MSIKTCSHRRPDSTKLVSRQYIENYWNLSPTLFTPPTPTRQNSFVGSESVVWNGFYTSAIVTYSCSIRRTSNQLNLSLSYNPLRLLLPCIIPFTLCVSLSVLCPNVVCQPLLKFYLIWFDTCSRVSVNSDRRFTRLWSTTLSVVVCFLISNHGWGESCRNQIAW